MSAFLAFCAFRLTFWKQNTIQGCSIVNNPRLWRTRENWKKKEHLNRLQYATLNTHLSYIDGCKPRTWCEIRIVSLCIHNYVTQYYVIMSFACARRLYEGNINTLIYAWKEKRPHFSLGPRTPSTPLPLQLTGDMNFWSSPSGPSNLNVLSNNTSPSQTSTKATHTCHMCAWLFEWSSHWLDSGDVWHFKILLFVESVPVTGRQNNWTGALNGFSIWLDWAGMCLFHPIPLQIHCTY